MHHLHRKNPWILVGKPLEVSQRGPMGPQCSGGDRSAGLRLWEEAKPHIKKMAGKCQLALAGNRHGMHNLWFINQS